jgi:hypothetical protein
MPYHKPDPDVLGPDEHPKPDQAWFMIANFPECDTRIYYGGEDNHPHKKAVFVAHLAEIEPYDHPCDLLLDTTKPIELRPNGEFVVPIRTRDWKRFTHAHGSHTWEHEDNKIGSYLKAAPAIWLAGRFDMPIVSHHGPFRVRDLRGHERIWSTPFVQSEVECERHHD